MRDYEGGLAKEGGCVVAEAGVWARSFPGSPGPYKVKISAYPDWTLTLRALEIFTGVLQGLQHTKDRGARVCNLRTSGSPFVSVSKWFVSTIQGGHPSHIYVYLSGNSRNAGSTSVSMPVELFYY